MVGWLILDGMDGWALCVFQDSKVCVYESLKIDLCQYKIFHIPAVPPIAAS